MWCPYHYITTQRQYATGSDPLPMAVSARNSNHTDGSSNTNTGKQTKITRAARYSNCCISVYTCFVALLILLYIH